MILEYFFYSAARSCVCGCDRRGEEEEGVVARAVLSVVQAGDFAGAATCVVARPCVGRSCVIASVGRSNLAGVRGLPGRTLISGIGRFRIGVRNDRGGVGLRLRVRLSRFRGFNIGRRRNIRLRFRVRLY